MWNVMYDMVLYMRREETVRKEYQVADLKERYYRDDKSPRERDYWNGFVNALKWVLNE